MFDCVFLDFYLCHVKFMTVWMFCQFTLADEQPALLVS